MGLGIISIGGPGFFEEQRVQLWSPPAIALNPGSVTLPRGEDKGGETWEEALAVRWLQGSAWGAGERHDREGADETHCGGTLSEGADWSWGSGLLRAEGSCAPQLHVLKPNPSWMVLGEGACGRQVIGS